ncbi:MAG: hypothetical protein ACYSOJ_09025 [Planctomycetota bacterium]|jgi:hypothetical protein
MTTKDMKTYISGRPQSNLASSSEILNLTSSQVVKSELPTNITGGWANYINGDLTPITVPANVETKLTLDTTNGEVINQFLPFGVTSVWNSQTSQFDFSELKVGDMVDIRVDGSLTNSGINETFVLNLVSGIGTSKEFSLPMASGVRFFSGTSLISRYNGIFIGSPEVRDNPAELRIISSSTASGYLIDIYVKVLSVLV